MCCIRLAMPKVYLVYAQQDKTQYVTYPSPSPLYNYVSCPSFSKADDSYTPPQGLSGPRCQEHLTTGVQRRHQVTSSSPETCIYLHRWHHHTTHPSYNPVTYLQSSGHVAEISISQNFKRSDYYIIWHMENVLPVGDVLFLGIQETIALIHG